MVKYIIIVLSYTSILAIAGLLAGTLLNAILNGGLPTLTLAITSPIAIAGLVVGVAVGMYMGFANKSTIPGTNFDPLKVFNNKSIQNEKENISNNIKLGTHVFTIYNTHYDSYETLLPPLIKQLYISHEYSLPHKIILEDGFYDKKILRSKL